MKTTLICSLPCKEIDLHMMGALAYVNCFIPTIQQQKRVQTKAGHTERKCLKFAHLLALNWSVFLDFNLFNLMVSVTEIVVSEHVYVTKEKWSGWWAEIIISFFFSLLGPTIDPLYFGSSLSKWITCTIWSHYVHQLMLFFGMTLDIILWAPWI